MRLSKDIFVAIMLVGAAAVWPVAAFAEEEEHGEHAAHVQHDEHSHGTEGHDEGHHYRNGLALFLGVTDEAHHGTAETIGLEYGHLLSDHWAIGGLIDYAASDHRNWVVAPALFWRPFGQGLTIMAAPGLEYHDGRGEVDEHHLLKADAAEVDYNETYFVMRFGAAYWFHVGSRYGIGPTVNVDFVDGHEVWIYGVAFEVMF